MAVVVLKHNTLITAPLFSGRESLPPLIIQPPPPGRMGKASCRSSYLSHISGNEGESDGMHRRAPFARSFQVRKPSL